MGRVGGYGGKSPRHLAGHEPALPSKGRGRSKVPAAKKKQEIRAASGAWASGLKVHSLVPDRTAEYHNKQF